MRVAHTEQLNNLIGVKMAKRARKTKNQQNQKHHEDVINISAMNKRRSRSVVIIPKSLTQEDYIEYLEDESTHIVFAMGPAGTGKTLLGVLAAIRDFKDGLVEKIVVTRPAVSVDEQHGFLPGTLEEKMAPWTRPIFDVFNEYWTPQQVTGMIEDGVIEISPLAYMRGRTFKNAYIIADEMQNATPSQMKMLLTRIGDGSRIVVTGDLNQHDRGFEQNGLRDFVHKLKSRGSDMIGVVEFQRADVRRHAVVSEVLTIYGDEDE
jgi:phosphate starvation-inducible protein PhoH and related proteins